MVANLRLKGFILFIALMGFNLLSLPTQAQQLTRFNPGTHSLMINLTEIASSSDRYEVYDFLKSNSEIEVLPFENASKVILTSNVLSQIELQQYYEAAVQRIIRNNQDISKEMQTKVIVDFASKYGFDTANNLMRSVTETENDSCHRSLPFCTDLIYNFPAGVNSGNGQSGPAYGCLGSTPNPAWYHMKIAIPGSLTIKMFSTPARDIDFILWGPFDDPATPCAGGLTANKIIDCSYSTAPIEFCDISNGILGKYYILLITNYSNQPCNITFQKTGGTGATDCTIVPPPIGSNSPLCYGEDILLTADDFAGATYQWSGPNGWSSNQQNPVIQNAELTDSGIYSLVITVGGSSSDPISTNVVVNALAISQFTGENVCFGDTTHFTNTSTTNPPNQTITSRLWNFGDGQTSSLANPSHVYTAAGNFTVTLTSYTGLFNCQDVISHVVVVNANPIPAFAADAVCFGEATVFDNQSTTNPPGQTITGYLWNFGDGATSTLENPTHTYANPDIYNVTLTCQTGMNNCEQTVSHDVTLNTVPVPAFTTEEVCFGSPTTFENNSTTNPPGETITSYLWNFGDGETSNQEEPTHSYATPGDYVVSLTCYTGVQSCPEAITQTAKVNEKPDVYAGEDAAIANGWTANLLGTVNGGSGNFTYAWTPADKVVNPNVLATTTTSLVQTQEFTLTATDIESGCVSIDKVMINVTGGALFVQASAAPDDICKGESSNLLAYTGGGAGNYTYSWTANIGTFNSDIVNPTVTPEQTTTYSVEVFDGQVYVNSSVTVTVRPFPVAIAGIDKTINVGTSLTLTGNTVGGSGNHTYLWSPADSLADRVNGQYLQNPLTKLLYDTVYQTVFTLIINDQNGCISEPDEMIVTLGGTMLAVIANVDEPEICFGESAIISAKPTGGVLSNYSISWDDDNPATNWTSTDTVVTVTPIIPTTYIVTLNDGFKTVYSSVHVFVNELPVVDLLPVGMNYYLPNTINVCVTDTVWLDAGAYADGTSMSYMWNNSSSDRRVRAETLGLWEDTQTFSVVVTNPVTGCSETGTISILFDFEACNLGIEDKTDVSNKLLVKPNPTNGMFTIEISDLPEDGTLKIYSQSGAVIEERVLSSTDQNSKSYAFDLTSYPQGAYLILYSSKSYRAIKQIIKN